MFNIDMVDVIIGDFIKKIDQLDALATKRKDDIQKKLFKVATIDAAIIADKDVIMRADRIKAALKQIVG